MSVIDLGIDNAKVVSFANDTRLYSKIDSADDCDALQAHLDTVYSWANNHNMCFNAKKFKYISYICSVVSASNCIYILIYV